MPDVNAQRWLNFATSLHFYLCEKSTSLILVVDIQSLFDKGHQFPLLICLQGRETLPLSVGTLG